MVTDVPADVKVVFMGSSDFSSPSLRRISQKFSVQGVITQPDRPAGRRRYLNPSPVKILAAELGLDIFQPENLIEYRSIERLKDWQPDLIIVVAYGQILNQIVLDIPQYGCINVHASLLPRWRGASPIQAAILHGDEFSGITIMKMDIGVDTGPILANHLISILPFDTAGSLSERLSVMGADLLINTLPKYTSGQIKPQPQNNDNATYCGIMKKEDGYLDFQKDAGYLVRQVAAYNPWPGAFILCENNYIKVLKAHAEEIKFSAIGERSVHEKKPAVCTSSGWLILDEVQPESKRIMSGEAFLAGARYW